VLFCFHVVLVLGPGSVIHQNIDSPQLSLRDSNDTCHLFILGQVAQGNDGFAAVTAYLGRHPFGSLAAATMDYDGSSLLGKAPGNAFANTAGTARHKNAPVLQF